MYVFKYTYLFKDKFLSWNLFWTLKLKNGSFSYAKNLKNCFKQNHRKIEHTSWQVLNSSILLTHPSRNNKKVRLLLVLMEIKIKELERVREKFERWTMYQRQCPRVSDRRSHMKWCRTVRELWWHKHR